MTGDEVGEIVIRGPDVFAGGWLKTGDLARVDDEGYAYIIDRGKDMIISGGFDIHPTEVEQALYADPAVCEACVVGVPDPTWGEAVKAVVVLRDGQRASEAEVIAHCRSLLAGFKTPRSIDFVAELPRNAIGKLARQLVREAFRAGHSRRVG